MSRVKIKESLPTPYIIHSSRSLLNSIFDLCKLSLYSDSVKIYLSTSTKLSFRLERREKFPLKGKLFILFPNLLCQTQSEHSVIEKCLISIFVPPEAFHKPFLPLPHLPLPNELGLQRRQFCHVFLDLFRLLLQHNKQHRKVKQTRKICMQKAGNVQKKLFSLFFNLFYSKCKFICADS